MLFTFDFVPKPKHINSDFNYAISCKPNKTTHCAPNPFSVDKVDIALTYPHEVKSLKISEQKEYSIKNQLFFLNIKSMGTHKVFTVQNARVTF